MLAGRESAIWARHLHGGGSEPDAVLLHRVRQSVAVARDLGLTPREAEVLAHAATGLSDAELARHLAITVRTVGKHLEHIYRKLGVPGRTAAAATLNAAVDGTPPPSTLLGLPLSDAGSQTSVSTGAKTPVAAQTPKGCGPT
jgi:DNA-binding CsgD family transcriptional regulator